MYDIYAPICFYVYFMYVYVYYLQPLPIESRAKNQISGATNIPSVQILELEHTR